MLQPLLTRSSILNHQSATPLLQGLLAVVLFSLTVPMTKIAMTEFSTPFIAASRGFIAGSLCLMVVIWQGWKFPSLKECGWLLLSGLGVVVAFPYLLSVTLNSVSAANMGIILAGLPLATSLMAVLLLGERYGLGFWLCALAGAGVLILYFSQLDAAALPSDADSLMDLFLLALCTLAFGGMGYASGTRAAKTLGGWPTICWMLVLYLPLTALAFGYFSFEQFSYESVSENTLVAESVLNDSHQDIFSFASTIVTGGELKAWLSIMYLALVSQWWGFRFLYSAMAQAGAGTVGQIQLLQPFFTLVFCALLLAEPLYLSQFTFLILIIFLVAGAIRYK